MGHLPGETGEGRNIDRRMTGPVVYRRVVDEAVTERLAGVHSSDFDDLTWPEEPPDITAGTADHLDGGTLHEAVGSAAQGVLPFLSTLAKLALIASISDSWSPTCIADIYGRSPARRRAGAAFHRTGERRTATTGGRRSGLRRCRE